MEIKIDNGNWLVVKSGALNLFEKLPLSNLSIGSHQIEIRYHNYNTTIDPMEWTIHIVDDVKFIFYDNSANSYHVWKTNSTNEFKKPVILIEGFDPTNENNPSKYYKIGEEIIDKLLSLGKEIIIVNFSNGGQDIANNATVFKTILNDVNARKIGSEPTIVIGVSMGGVIGRMALVQMENENKTHDVSYFISIDSPQNGAILDENLLNYLKDLPSNNPPLESMAAKQLLKYNPYVAGKYVINSVHQTFYTNLRNLNNNNGYPVTSQNIGVAFSNPTIKQANGDWLDFEWNLPGTLLFGDKTFRINQSDNIAEPGSMLPLLSAMTYSRSSVFIASSTRLSNTNPTFVLHKSALDIDENGVSAFGSNIIYPNSNYYHDEFPTELVDPILEKIGLQKTISSNTTLQTNQVIHSVIVIKPNIELIITGTGTLSNKLFIVGNNAKLKIVSSDVSFNNVSFQAEDDIMKNYSIELASNSMFRIPNSSKVTIQGKPSLTGYRLQIDQGGELEIKDGANLTFSDSFQFLNYGTTKIGAGVTMQLKNLTSYTSGNLLINKDVGTQSTINISANGVINIQGAATVKKASFIKSGSSNFSHVNITGNTTKSFENVAIEGSQYGFIVSNVSLGSQNLFKNIDGNHNYYSTIKVTNSTFGIQGFDGNNAVQDGISAYSGSNLTLRGEVMATNNLLGLRSAYTSSILYNGVNGALRLKSNTRGVHTYNDSRVDLYGRNLELWGNTRVDNMYGGVPRYDLYAVTGSHIYAEGTFRCDSSSN